MAHESLLEETDSILALDATLERDTSETPMITGRADEESGANGSLLETRDPDADSALANRRQCSGLCCTRCALANTSTRFLVWRRT
jgi:hypothetical protein